MVWEEGVAVLTSGLKFIIVSNLKDPRPKMLPHPGMLLARDEIFCHSYIEKKRTSLNKEILAS